MLWSSLYILKWRLKSGGVTYPRAHSFLGTSVPLLLNQPVIQMITSVSVESLVSSGSVAFPNLVSPRTPAEVKLNVSRAALKRKGPPKSNFDFILAFLLEEQEHALYKWDKLPDAVFFNLFMYDLLSSWYIPGTDRWECWPSLSLLS